MSETQAPPEEETTPEEPKGESAEKTPWKITKIQDGYESTVKYYRDIDSPPTADGVLAELEDQFKGILSCDCKLCAIRAAQTCETYVIISEVLKLVSPDCENGVAGLIFRLHESRMRAMMPIIDAGVRKVFEGEVESEPIKVASIPGSALMKILKEALTMAEETEEQKTETEESSEQQE